MERFIISTGRCGSTLLSTMLSRHPEVLVLSEFIQAFRPVDYGSEPISGEYFSQCLAAPHVIIDLATRRGFIAEELPGEFGGNLHNWSLPFLKVAALPLLTDDPEPLFQECIEAARTFPTQTMRQHYLMFIEWLRVKFKRKLWVERSGGSIEILPEIVGMYPDARFVHIHRDGPETALSMREHAYFQLYVSFFCDPPTREELERTELAGKPITDNDPLKRRMSVQLPSYEQFGKFWSRQVEVGFPILAKMSTEQLLTITFEDLISNPVQILREVARFLDFPESPGWIEAAAQLRTGKTKKRAHLLPDQDRAALKEAAIPDNISLAGQRSGPSSIQQYN